MLIAPPWPWVKNGVFLQGMFWDHTSASSFEESLYVFEALEGNQGGHQGVQCSCHGAKEASEAGSE